MRHTPLQNELESKATLLLYHAGYIMLKQRRGVTTPHIGNIKIKIGGL